MSLRLRLSILYTALLGSVLLLFGLVVYILVSVNLLNQIDSSLVSVANSLTDNLEVDSSNRFDLSVITTFQTAENILFQLWGNDGSLQISRPPDWQSTLDENGLQADQMVIHSVSTGGVHLRVLSIPLSSPRGTSGVLQVAVSQAYLDITQDTLATVLVVITLFAMLVTALISWSATGKTLRPLDTVTRVAKQIVQADDLSRRIPEGEVEDDEIGSLINAYNSSLERVEKLFHAQRRFLADVSHDLRTPLTVIKGNVSLMRKMKKADEESMQQIDQEVDRLTRLVGDLLLLAQAETGNLDLDLQPLELDQLVKEVFNQIKLLARKKVTLKLEELDPVVVLGDRDRLKQVLLNLTGNAIQYTPSEGIVSIALRKMETQAQLIVTDTGLGIPEEDLPHIFERFYRGEKSRTHSATSGFGLGLSITYWIVQNHGGTITVESKVGQGSTFCVWLPLLNNSAGGGSPAV